jgi:ligand-binding SRPBCC domain-containing protein
MEGKKTGAYRLECEMISGRPLPDTFAIFEDPYNLAKITPPWLNFKVTSAQRVEMRAGAEIRYVIRWLGLPIRWKTRITKYDPPREFVDEQERGPYALWRHRHTFEQTPEGTKVADRVEYRLPFGFIGAFIHATVVRRQLLAIFRHRQRELGRMFGPESRQLVAPRVSRMDAGL